MQQVVLFIMVRRRVVKQQVDVLGIQLTARILIIVWVVATGPSAVLIQEIGVIVVFLIQLPALATVFAVQV